MKKLIREAIDTFDFEGLKEKRITIGFDGCADIICKAVRKNGNGKTQHFETMTEFGKYISDMSGISCSIELEEQLSKAGGNSAILANAISNFEVDTSVVGLFGKDGISDVFQEIAEKCKLYSYRESALAISLEFRDGKLMLSPRVSVDGDAWEQVVAAVGQDNLQAVFRDADMLGLVNWGELNYSTPLWNSVYEYMSDEKDFSKQVIVDLADCLRRESADIEEILETIQAFGKIRTVILSLNESEAVELGKIFGLNTGAGYRDICQNLAQRISVQRLVLHSSKSCYTCDEQHTLSELPTQFNELPKLLTGGGDNFNAGYAIGCLLGMRGELCNVYGNAVSSYYIKTGRSPSVPALLQHLENWYLSLE